MMKKFLAVLVVLPLVACSSGPSESEMNEAVKKSIDMRNTQMAAAVGGILGSDGQGMVNSMKAEVPEVKKISCKEDGDKAYLCDIELITKNGKNVVPARFVKASDGWALAQ